MSYVVTSTCILCGACVSGCESQAITEGETKAEIDVSLCIECGTCASNCPSEAIVFIEDTEVSGTQSDSINLDRS